MLTVTNATGTQSSVGAVVLVRPRMVIVMAGVCSETEGVFSEKPDKPGSMIKLKHDLLGRGIPADDIIPFSYSMNGWNVGYNQDDTLVGVGHASGNLKQIYEAYPDVEFDIIAHSLGGVVALDAMNRFPFLRERTHRIITVDSPIGGVGEVGAWLASKVEIFAGCGDFSGTLNQTWKDLGSGSDVIKNIKADPWNDLEVISFVCVDDPVVLWETAFLYDSKSSVSGQDYGIVPIQKMTYILRDKGKSWCVEQSSNLNPIARHSFLLDDPIQRTRLLDIALAKTLGDYHCTWERPSEKVITTTA